jgi:beta-galactosidase GanA
LVLSAPFKIFHVNSHTQTEKNYFTQYFYTMNIRNHLFYMFSALPLIAGILFAGCTGASSRTETPVAIPRLEKRGDVTQLTVGGKPYLALAGELHNSSSSGTEYMKGIWGKLQAAGLNTVLAVVSWEQVEPEEGVFDFSILDDLIRDARAHRLKLVVLWFGSWKNGISSYQPAWVKKDAARFPLVKTKSGASLNILSTMGEQTIRADAKAYTAMMRHIRETDAERTVIMIQMENEVGLHGDTRDYHPEAVARFNAAVPEALMNYLVAHKDRLLPELKSAWDSAGGKTSGAWEEVFGASDYTDELFMAWNYAVCMNAITEAGKAEYPLPVFVNAWIVQPEDRHPGDYPSGGPQAHTHDVWRAGAPAIDMLCPDIYLPDFPAILQLYSRSGNPVFIPESAAGVNGAANAVYAIGEMGAIGYSPFGIESRSNASSDNTGGNDVDPFTFACRQLATLADKILECQAKGSIRAAWLKEGSPSVPETTLELGDYRIKVELRKTRNSSVVPPVGYALVIMERPGEYTVMGYDADVTFEPLDGHSTAGLAKVQEGDFVNGEWVAERWLNGDEIQLRYDLTEAQKINQSGQGLRFRSRHPKIQKVWLYRY